MAKILDQSAAITPQDDEQAIIARLEAALHAEPLSQLMGPDGSSLILPPSVRQALQQVVSYLAQGAHVQVIPISDELTPQQAADILCVSRQDLLKLVSDGKLVVKKYGARQRIAFKDILAYQQQQEITTRSLIDEMTQLSQESSNYH